MNRLLSSLMLSGVALLGCATALPAAAQFAKPEDAIKYRKAAFTLMGSHFGRVAAMANGRVPFDAKTAADNAELAAMLAKLPFTGFVPGSDKGSTQALPEVWTEMDRFNKSATDMQDAMAKLNVAAKGGNLDAIKAAVGDTGKTCKSCHDHFRKE